VTVAPGTTAPCASATTPEIKPVVTPWACARGARATTTAASTTPIAQNTRDLLLRFIAILLKKMDV
jgi:hypothetical protein